MASRKKLLIEQRQILFDKVTEIQNTIKRLDYKIERYEESVLKKEKDLKN